MKPFLWPTYQSIVGPKDLYKIAGLPNSHRRWLPSLIATFHKSNCGSSGIMLDMDSVYLGLNPDYATYKLCNFGQVTELL